jgi:ribosomal protein S18 acetylase RimI-like enzyme
VSRADPLAQYPRTVVLIDGAHLVLRPVEPRDAGAVAALVARLPAAEAWYLPESGEGPGAAGSPAAAGPSRLATVLAVDGERVAAAVTLRRPPGPSRRHLAELSVVLDPAYRGRRLGTWLLLDCVHLAADLGVERLVAEVPVHETAELAALRRLDFVQEAILADRHRTPDGESCAVAVMVKTVHASWPNF